VAGCMAVPVAGSAGNRPGRMFMHARHLGEHPLLPLTERCLSLRSGCSVGL